MNSADLTPCEHATDTVVPRRAKEYAGDPSHRPRNSALDERTGEGDIDDRADDQSRQRASGAAEIDSINELSLKLQRGSQFTYLIRITQLTAADALW